MAHGPRGPRRPRGVLTIAAADGDARLAAAIAAQVGRRLLALRADPPPGGPDVLRAAGDRTADLLVHELLARSAPGDAVLSEESPDTAARLGAARVWIVDPLDGTREFGLAGRSDWAVHVALWDAAAGDLVAGAVALPADGTVLDSATVHPVSPDRPGPGAGGRRARVVVSRSRPPAAGPAVARALDAELVQLGSAGAKVAAVVRGTAAAYVETGGLHEWDTAAPVVVARAAGLVAVHPDGTPPAWNRPDPAQSGLVVCRPELLAAVLAAVAGADR